MLPPFAPDVRAVPGRARVFSVLLWLSLLQPFAAVVADSTTAGKDQRLAVVQGIRVHDAPDATRLVIDTNRPLEYRLGGRGSDLHISFNNLAPGSDYDLDNVNLAGSRISRLRFERRRGARARLALPTRLPLRAEAFRLQPVASYGHRLVVDLFVDLAAKEGARGQPKTAPNQQRAVVVALDAGHGGEDPGTLGAGGVREAHVVMTLARLVAARLQPIPGLNVVLVRNGDYYVRRHKRKALAREARADLFVSLHADAFRQSSVQGASVYALSSGGASSSAAAWLAARDSRSDLIGGVASDVRLKDTDTALAQVLLDLSMQAQRNSSLNLADALLRELDGSVHLHKHTVELASFEVLKSPDIPSVLVEIGFLSNPEEARRLSDVQHQRQLADALAAGILRYIERYPAPGSLLAAKPAKLKAARAGLSRTQSGGARARRHVIQPGDSLSEVAELYGVSTAALRQANALQGDRIKTGQVLTIPLP